MQVRFARVFIPENLPKTDYKNILAQLLRHNQGYLDILTRREDISIEPNIIYDYSHENPKAVKFLVTVTRYALGTILSSGMFCLGKVNQLKSAEKTGQLINKYSRRRFLQRFEKTYKTLKPQEITQPSKKS
jgi:hypothetical protein